MTAGSVTEAERYGLMHRALAETLAACAIPGPAAVVLHQLLDLLVSDDLLEAGTENLLVERGVPFEVAVRPCADRCEVSFAVEPLAGRPIGSRWPSLLRRARAAGHLIGVDESFFDRLTATVGPTGDRYESVEWFMHVAIMATGQSRVILKLYLGPCTNTGQEALVGTVGGSHDDAVWTAVSGLLGAFGLALEVDKLTLVRERLSVPGRPAPQVTFVGVDLEPGQKPRFKVYINPNIA